MCAVASTHFLHRHPIRLSLSLLRTYINTYIGVWWERLFVVTAPPLGLSSSLRGGIASWWALALLGGLTVCRWHWLTLEKDRETQLFIIPALYKNIKLTHFCHCMGLRCEETHTRNHSVDMSSGKDEEKYAGQNQILTESPIKTHNNTHIRTHQCTASTADVSTG